MASLWLWFKTGQTQPGRCRVKDNRANSVNTPLRVLIVEDSEEDTLLLLRQLKQVGYNPTFERVDTPAAMSKALGNQPWDIVISDYAMPRFTGSEALEILKTSGLDLPFIFVSGAISEDIAVDAMKAGAHDYVMIGNLKRLAPAVERELREAEVRRQRKDADERLRHLAYHDPVTDLPNHALVHQRLEQAILLGRRENKRVALLIMKINHFSKINEALGHEMADFHLKQITQRIRGDCTNLTRSDA